MKIIVILWPFLLFQPSFGQTTCIKETKEESKICNIILDLPEVRNADNYVRKVSKGERHLIDFIESDPAKNNPYYQVLVAEDNGVAYATHFIFFVKAKTHKIFYCDVVTNKMIPEVQCRKKLIADYPIK